MNKEENIDYMLDFYNAIEEYTAKSNEDDSTMVISHNWKRGSLFVSCTEDVYPITFALSTEKEYLTNLDEDKKDVIEAMRKNILNISISILSKRPELRKEFIDKVNSFKEGEIADV